VANRWLQVTVLAAAGLTAWLGYELTRTPAVPSPPAPAAQAGPADLPAPDVQPRALASLRATLERPLFTDDRRPAPVADTAGASADQPETTKALPLRLTAVVVGPDGKRSVMVEVTGQERPLLAGKGDQVGGWRVDEITDEAVAITAGGEHTVVPLRVFETPSPGKHSPARAVTRKPSGEPPRRPPTPKAVPAAADSGAAPKGDARPSPQQVGTAPAAASDRAPAKKRN
jgi:hypothetical protein